MDIARTDILAHKNTYFQCSNKYYCRVVEILVLCINSKTLLKFEFLQCMWQGNVQETNVWRSNCGSCRHCFLEFGSNLCKNSNSCSQTNARTRVLATMQKKTNEFLLSYILGAISTSTSRSVTFTARTSVQAA